MSEPDLFQTHRRLYGFRFSIRDGIAIVVAVGMAIGLWKSIGSLALLPPVALGHFFLFCNIFRLRRAFELPWAAIFIVNFAVQVFRWSGGQSDFNWWIVAAIQTPVTLLFIFLELRSREYHGIGSRKINPHLIDYLKMRAAQASSSEPALNP